MRRSASALTTASVKIDRKGSRGEERRILKVEIRDGEGRREESIKEKRGVSEESIKTRESKEVTGGGIIRSFLLYYCTTVLLILCDYFSELGQVIYVILHQ